MNENDVGVNFGKDYEKAFSSFDISNGNEQIFVNDMLSKTDLLKNLCDIRGAGEFSVLFKGEVQKFYYDLIWIKPDKTNIIYFSQNEKEEYEKIKLGNDKFKIFCGSTCKADDIINELLK